MDDEAERTRALQQRQLVRQKIAHAKLARLALLLQPAERLRHLRRVHQVIGPVQLINVDGLHTESL